MKHEFDVIPNFIQKIDGKKCWKKKEVNPVLEKKDIVRLKSIFEQDRMQLEELLGRKIEIWW